MFLNLFMLGGLSAVLIPIIIHLLNRRKFERVVWAAMRFVRLSVEKNQRRIKVEDMLLLILRCLLLALLAIALARPVLRAAVGGLGLSKITAVIVLDNSYSMTQTDGIEPKFEAAKRAADEVIKTMPTGSSVAVLLCSDVVNKLIPEPTYDLTLASEQIKEAPVFDRGTNLLSGIQSAMEILNGRPELRKEIYVITDGQGGGWGRMEEIRRVLEDNHREVRAHLLFVGRPEEKNLGIASLKLDGGVVAVNVPVRLNVRVQNFGKGEVNDVNVAIFVDGEPPMDQTTIASIPGGESRSVSLFARMKSDGYHTVTAKIDGDHLPADDWRTVALRAVKEVKVLLIDGDPGREPRESETFFLRNALRPVPRAQWDDYFVKLTVKTPTELEGTRFEDFDAVMSANVTDFSASALGQLTNYVKGGGGLVVFLGDNINVNFYNEQLYKKLGLLPAGIGIARGDAKAQEQWFNLADKGYDHPIVSIWKDPNAGSLSSVRFFRAFELVEGADSRVVLRFADQKPAMMEKDYGLGRVVLFASTADTDWNDLGARAGTFVPLMLRTLGYLVARQDEHLTIMAGQEFSHAPPVEFLNKDAIISKAPRHFSSQTKDEVHEAKRVELVNGAPFVQFGGTDFAGGYEIRVEGSAPIRFAVQSDSAESNLEALNETQYGLLGEVAHVVKWSPGAALEETLEKGRVGTEFWLPLALAAAVLGTMETLLAHWFSKSK